MNEMNWIALPHEIVAGKKTKDKLLELLKRGAFLLSEDEPLLFRKGFEEHLLAYLEHHSLAECNQHRLFAKSKEEALTFFICRWSLASKLEAALFKPKNRKWLKLYINQRPMMDAANEVRLFGPDLRIFRRNYVKQYVFYSVEAEKKLLQPEFSADLREYISQGNALFPDVETDFFATADSKLVKKYKRLHPK